MILLIYLIEERAVIQNNKYRKSIQGKVYHDYYYNNYTKYNWIAFFSIDEFITVNYKYNNVFEFLNY